jgi:ribosomal protein S18 acetylase RimI-like enzyme
MLRIERLTPGRRADFLRFFDHERGATFADNPQWAKCYCHFYHVPKSVRWPSLDAQANRMAMSGRIECGEMEGYLAYADGEVVGWLNAQPRHKFPHACARMGVRAPAVDVPDHAAAFIVCFVIAPGRRRSGIARALLDFALADLAARGVRVVDAFPFNVEAGAAAADHYHGPHTLLAAAGFSTLTVGKDLTVVRKLLTRA